MDCPVIIFYEMHLNPTVGNIIHKLMPTLSNYGFKKLAVEFPVTSSFKEVVKTEKKWAKKYKEDAEDYKMTLKTGKFVDEMIEYTYNNIYLSPPKDSTLEQKKTFLSSIQNYLIGKSKSSTAKVKILEDLAKYKINYNFIGGKDGVNFDSELIKNTKSACDENKTGIIIYLGINHFEVGKNLRDEGTQILEFYITSVPPESTKDTPNNNEYLIRNDLIDHDVIVIDLFKNPNLKPAEIIKEYIYDDDYYSL